MGKVGASARMASRSAVTVAAVATAIAGVGVAVPQTDRAPETALRQVTLAATTIPIIDFNETFGQLALSRKLTAIFERSGQDASAALQALSSTAFANVAGYSWAADLPVSFDRDPGHVRASFLPSWAGGAAANTPNSQFSFNHAGRSILSSTLFGDNVDGYGASLEALLFQGQTIGTLSHTINSQNYGVSHFGTTVLGSVITKFGVLPSGGAYGTSSVTPIVNSGSTTYQLGPLGGLAVAKGISVGADNTVCVGSAVAGCGVIASTANVLNFNGSVVRLTPVGGIKTVAAINLPEEFKATLAPDHLSVSGQVGGQVAVGTRIVGKVVPFGFDVPLPTANGSLLRSQAAGRTSLQTSSLGAKPARLISAGTTRTSAQSAVSRTRTTIVKALKDKASRAHHDDSTDSST
jgi:hypothetical protein